MKASSVPLQSVVALAFITCIGCMAPAVIETAWGPAHWEHALAPGVVVGSLTCIDDVDGDGCAEIVARLSTDRAMNGEQVHDESGAELVAMDAERVLLLSGRTGIVLRTIASEHGSWSLGQSTAVLGSGDGGPHLAIGDPDAEGLAGRVVLCAATASDGVRFMAAPEGARGFGRGLLATRDLDGDGERDLLVVAPGSSGRHGLVGASAIYAMSSRRDEMLWALHDDRRYGSALWPMSAAGESASDALHVAAWGGGQANCPLRVFCFDVRSGAIVWESELRIEPYEIGSILRGVCVGDVDGDGEVDVVVLVRTGPRGGGKQNNTLVVLSGASGDVLASCATREGWRWMAFDLVPFRWHSGADSAAGLLMLTCVDEAYGPRWSKGLDLTRFALGHVDDRVSFAVSAHRFVAAEGDVMACLLADDADPFAAWPRPVVAIARRSPGELVRTSIIVLPSPGGD